MKYEKAANTIVFKQTSMIAFVGHSKLILGTKQLVGEVVEDWLDSYLRTCGSVRKETQINVVSHYSTIIL